MKSSLFLFNKNNLFLKLLFFRLILIIFVVFIIVFISKMDFYYVNYYNKDGFVRSKIVLGKPKFDVDKKIYSLSINENGVDVFENFDIVLNVDNVKKVLKSNFSESLKDVLVKAGFDKKELFVLLRNGNVGHFNPFVSSVLTERFKFYTPRKMYFVFDSKKFKVNYFVFYDNQRIKGIIFDKVKKIIINKGVRIENIKGIDFVDLKEGFELTSFSVESFDSYVGVNVKFISKKEEIIPYQRVVFYSSSLPQGETRVTRKGKNGKVFKEYLVYLNYDGTREIELLRKNVIEEKVDEIVEVGIGPIYSLEGKPYYILESSGYTASVGGVGYYTATGSRVRRGVVAVDPSIIPLGTKLYVEGYGYAQALDTGSAIKGFKIDLYFESYQEAIRWGRRKVKVYLVKE